MNERILLFFLKNALFLSWEYEEILIKHFLYFRWSILERHPNSTSPNINDWIPDNDPKLNFTNVVAKLHHEIQSDGFFTWIVAEDDHNSSQHVIQMDQVSKYLYSIHIFIYKILKFV